MENREKVIAEIIQERAEDGGLLVEMANVLVDQEQNVSIQINLREGLNTTYFNFYNHQDYERADKVCRISFYGPDYIEHRNLDGKKNWVLNASERKTLIKCLTEVDEDSGRSCWQELIIAFNREKPGDPLSAKETKKNTMENRIHPNHLPIDLPMPNYRELR